MVYSFICDTENGGCGHSFEISCFISEYDAATKELRCSKCNQKAGIRRDYFADKFSSSIKLSDDQITVGHLAHRNTEKMSEEQKAKLHYEHNKYRFENPQEKELPNGMVRRKREYDNYLPVKKPTKPIKPKRGIKRRKNGT
jgi:hypothetical protein